MALTRNFRETVAARAKREPAFRDALLQEALQTLIEGDFPTGRTLLRDYINATIGFDGLSDETHLPVKSLMRMVGPSGNPTASNLMAIVQAVQRKADVRAHVEVRAEVMA